jgi:hypothetical protein
MSVLGALAGGYAQAAELENRRKFEADQAQRQAALGLTKILLESPNVPPEYKTSLVQYGMDVIHTPHGKKIPDFQKQVMSQVPALQTPGQTGNVAQPSLQLGGPSAPPQMPPPSNPAALGGGGPAASGKAPSLASSGASANGGAPGAMLPPVGPPPGIGGLPGAGMGSGGAGITMPGATSQVSLAPREISPAGQFHMYSPQELAQQQAQSANAALQTQIQGLKQQGFSDEQIAIKMGMSKLMPIPFGGLYNVGTGESVSPTNTPMVKLQYTTPGDPTPHFGNQSRAGGPIVDAATGQVVPGAMPFVASMMDTTKTGEHFYDDAQGNVHAVKTTTTTHKSLPSQKKGAAAAGSTQAPASGMGGTPTSFSPAPPPGGGGGRIVSGDHPKLPPDLVRADKSYKDISGQMDKLQKPLDDLASRFGRLEDTVKQGTPQADALVAPELLSVMAGGQGSGIRMNEAEINRIVGGRSKWEALKAAANKWSLNPDTATSITDAQRSQIRALMTAVSEKIAQKRQLLEQARTDLLKSTTPEEHRRILADVRSRVLSVDVGQQLGAPGTPPAPGQGGPAVGTVEQGYRFKGGNPADPNAWEKVK